jgi:hypothetical protein
MAGIGGNLDRLVKIDGRVKQMAPVTAKLGEHQLAQWDCWATQPLEPRVRESISP